MSVNLTMVKNVLGPLYLASQFNTALFVFECIYMVKVSTRTCMTAGGPPCD